MTTKTYATIGDSQSTLFAGWGVDGWQTHPARVARALRKRGLDYRARVFGIGGETSAQILARIGQMMMFDIPEIATVAAGVNDPANGINQAGTRLNIRCCLLALKHGARGDGVAPLASVAAPTNLPAGGMPGQRYVVVADNSTTGGVSALEAWQTATITGTVASSAPAVWEYRLPLTGERGWGRVAVSTTAPTVVKKIVVLNANYLNWTTGGDTLVTPYATYVTVRAGQVAAVADENVPVNGVPSVVLADLYTFQRERIVAGIDLDFSAVSYDQTRSAHAVQNNQHHSAYGQWMAEQTILNAMPDEWVAV